MEKCDCDRTGLCQHKEVCELWATPCWVNTNAYKFVKGLSSRETRWEFLRRLPNYRQAWTHRGSSKGGFGLKVLIDPKLGHELLQPHHLAMLERLAGTALSNAIPAPPVSALFATPKLSSRDNSNLFLGASVQHLIDSGHVLFVTHPSVSTNKQLQQITHQLAKMRTEWRKEATKSNLRKNIPSQHSADRLIRILDAYNQEGLLGNAAKRRVKAEIGRSIFLRHDVGGTSWAKYVDAAYLRAENIALTPVDFS